MYNTTKKLNQKGNSNSWEKQLKNLNDIPKNIKISTITITCKLETDLFLENIGKYIELSDDDICYVKYGDDIKNVRSIIKTKPKKSKKKKKVKKIFYNQVTLKVKSINDKLINIKLFKNGSIQLTGCKNYTDFSSVINTICIKLRDIMGIKTKNKIILKPFASNIENLDIIKIKNFNIRLINSNFRINHKIDRAKFADLLEIQNIDCSYEPSRHAAINIKFKSNDNNSNNTTISIFIFESGAIIITAAKNKNHIINAYKFITEKIKENYNNILKKDITNLNMILNRINKSKLKKNRVC